MRGGVSGVESTIYLAGVNGVMHHYLVVGDLVPCKMMVLFSFMRMDSASSSAT